MKSEAESLKHCGAWGKENFINCGRQRGRGKRSLLQRQLKFSLAFTPSPRGEGEQIEPASVNVKAGIGFLPFKAIQILRVLSKLGGAVDRFGDNCFALPNWTQTINQHKIQKTFYFKKKIQV